MKVVEHKEYEQSKLASHYFRWRKYREEAEKNGDQDKDTYKPGLPLKHGKTRLESKEFSLEKLCLNA